MPTPVELKAGEAKLLSFTIVDEDGNNVDVSGATLTFKLKSGKETGSVAITKADADFASKGSGTATVKVSATDTDLTKGLYTGELKIQLAADNIHKSADLDFKILEAIT